MSFEFSNLVNGKQKHFVSGESSFIIIFDLTWGILIDGLLWNDSELDEPEIAEIITIDFKV